MIRTVTIAGVGLIGGSFALALRAGGFTGTILGVSSTRTLETAKRLGVIDEGVPFEDGMRRADLVYLAQPISQILEAIPRIAPLLGPEAVVTDAGSTKVQIVRAAEAHLPAGSFLGGHPMAGKESRGVESADANLFRDRSYILTPGPAVERANLDAFREMVLGFGCRLTSLTPAEHDCVVACCSHVPQLASTALAVAVSRANSTKAAAGPGLIDMTRLAMSTYDVWRDIIATNESEIGPALDRYISVLKELRSNLGNPEMEEYFAAGARLAKAVRGDS
jgi:prephenate dehydrogenase